MGVQLTSSTAVSNADATPRIPNSPYFDQGEDRLAVGVIEALVGDTAGSIYRFIRVPSSARIHDLRLSNDAMSGTTSVKIGLLSTAANGGAVPVAGSDALFATALDIHLAGAQVSVLFQNLDIAKGEKRLWELLALAADPFVEYDIAMTTTTQSGADGTMLLACEWTQ